MRPTFAMLCLSAALGLVLPPAVQAGPTAVAAAASAPRPPAATARTAADTAAFEQALRWYEAGRLVEARQAFERLARRGHALAHHNLAVMQLRGEAPGMSLQDAVRHMRTAALAGVVTAQYGLGQLYDSGRLGRPDPVQALVWYRQAAEHGSTAAAEEVGTAYYLGRGVARDPAQALVWFQQAARGGEVGAQYLLASMYEHGEGTRVDLRLAAYWYEAAARNGDPAAAIKLEEVLERLRIPDCDASSGRPC